MSSFNLTLFERLSSADLDACHALSLAVAWPHRRDDWSFLARGANGVLVHDKEMHLIGVGLWWAWNPEHGSLGMMVVHPDWQRRGIGRRMIKVISGQTDGMELHLCGSKTGVPLYRTEGFLPLSTICQHQGDFKPGAFSVAVKGIVRNYRISDFNALLICDTKACGIARTLLLTNLLTVSSTLVLERDGDIVGYCMRRPFGHGETIGPIVAPQEKDAIFLLRESMGSSSAFMRTDIFARARNLAAWLSTNGLPAVDTVVAMSRSTGINTSASSFYFGLAGQSLG